MDATLIEDPSEAANDDEESLCSASTQSSSLTTESVNANNRDFKMLVDGKSGTRHSIHLVAPTAQDKEAWISDISQCLDNIHMHSLLSPGIGGTSGGKTSNYPCLPNQCLMFSSSAIIFESFFIHRSSSTASGSTFIQRRCNYCCKSETPIPIAKNFFLMFSGRY